MRDRICGRIWCETNHKLSASILVLAVPIDRDYQIQIRSNYMYRLTATFNSLKPRLCQISSIATRKASHWQWLIVLAIAGGGTMVMPNQMVPVHAQTNPQGLSIQADTQEANSKTEVITAKGNVMKSMHTLKMVIGNLS